MPEEMETAGFFKMLVTINQSKASNFNAYQVTKGRDTTALCYTALGSRL
jgi:hypothetical protein